MLPCKKQPDRTDQKKESGFSKTCKLRDGSVRIYLSGFQNIGPGVGGFKDGYPVRIRSLYHLYCINFNTRAKKIISNNNNRSKQEVSLIGFL